MVNAFKEEEWKHGVKALIEKERKKSNPIEKETDKINVGAGTFKNK